MNEALPAIQISSFDLVISDLAHQSEQIIVNGLNHPSPLTLLLVFTGGLLTSIGPCSLSLLPITIAYLAGFKNQQSPFQRSIIFCSGIVLALVILGGLSVFLGRIYGQVPLLVPTLVALLAIFMGLNLLGAVPLSLPVGPDPEIWKEKVPSSLGALAAGLAFGLAGSPCTTPVLAVLLGWVAQTRNEVLGILFLACFAFGQVLPLILAGTAAGNIQRLVALRPFVSWVPPLSGVVLLITGVLTLLARWV